MATGRIPSEIDELSTRQFWPGSGAKPGNGAETLGEGAVPFRSEFISDQAHG
jgi:hypothetical protein